MSWRRPSKRSSRETLPLGPAKLYAFSILTIGKRRRAAFTRSSCRVSSFSSSSSALRWVSQSLSVTTCGLGTCSRSAMGIPPLRLLWACIPMTNEHRPFLHRHLPIDGVALIEDPVERHERQLVLLTHGAKFERARGLEPARRIARRRADDGRRDRLGLVLRHRPRLGRLRTQRLGGEPCGSELAGQHYRSVHHGLHGR